jgi:hypothetical protein
MSSEYYRKYALDCVLMANKTNEPRTKGVLIDMAQAWTKLALQAESLPTGSFGGLTLVSDRTRERA